VETEWGQAILGCTVLVVLAEYRVPLHLNVPHIDIVRSIMPMHAPRWERTRALDVVLDSTVPDSQAP